VAELNNRYYLFYSAATTNSDESHRLRVAIADDPAGPFIDAGRELMPDAGFTIDASPFRDPKTGQWFLFFAADFEEDEPQGTGLAGVSLADDLLSVTSAPKALVRAQGDWQIYERNRNYKGRAWAKWHCVEGPHCYFHNDRYYLFFSGGAWYGENYGVGFAVADHPLGPWSAEDSAQGPTVLKGIPGNVIGPGHSSCVLGPDGKTLFLVYHAWDAAKTARRMCIDPILWTDQGPKVDGPSTGPRTVD
jgi:GH43 family beta-xylosidase